MSNTTMPHALTEKLEINGTYSKSIENLNSKATQPILKSSSLVLTFLKSVSASPSKLGSGRKKDRSFWDVIKRRVVKAKRRKDSLTVADGAVMSASPCSSDYSFDEADLPELRGASHVLERGGNLHKLNSTAENELNDSTDLSNKVNRGNSDNELDSKFELEVRSTDSNEIEIIDACVTDGKDDLNKSVEDEGIEIKENLMDLSEIILEENTHTTVERLRSLDSISSALTPENTSDIHSGELDDRTSLASPDEDLSNYMDETLINGDEDHAEEHMTDEQQQLERDRAGEDDELYNIDVKKLAVSFLSAVEGTVTPHHAAEMDDLSSKLPKISDLVESYISSPTKPGDGAQPTDIPTGLSLKSMKSAYEASTHGPLKSSDNCLEEEGLQLNFSQMRDAYCNTVNQSTPATSSPLPEPSTNGTTGVDIKALRASYGDLTALIDGSDGLLQAAVQDPIQVSTNCRSCSKQVFQMEKIVAEKASWHKNCFRCSECNKSLTLETYQSHEGVLYCKPHFKELFRPKAVVEDPMEARKERSSSKPDYGLDELTSLDMRKRFTMFELAGQEEEEKKPEPVSVRRSQSMISRAARFLQENGDKEYGVDNSELGEYEEEDEDEDQDDDEEEEEEEIEEQDGVDENGEPIIIKTTRKKKKTRPLSFNNAGDLKEMKEKKNRRDEMTKIRKEELGRFRQMLCAGKNITLKEKFESGHFENEDSKDKHTEKEEIKIDKNRAARSLKEKFEKGQPFIMDEDGETNHTNKHVGELEEVEEIFKDAETASRARNLFKQIDSKANQDGSAILMRSQSFATNGRDNRRSMDGMATEDIELGRDPNLIRCTDNYQDDVDCRNTRSILNMFKKMEAKNTGVLEADDESGPRPLHRFTPPPEGEGEYDEEDEYTDEDGEYSDDDEYSEGEEDDDKEEDPSKAAYKDELLQMSAKKAAHLRAKFEKWEATQNDINKTNGKVEEDDEAMPSLDTARNLKAMFEEKAQEAAKPLVRERAKVNRFVGGGGDKCEACSKTVYAMEKFEVQGKIIHKTCFKCSICHNPLSMVTCSMGGGRLFCNAHYKKLFTEKGNYDAILPALATSHSSS